MDSSTLEEFGEVLLHVRDAAVRACDVNLKAEVRSPVAKRWRDSGDNLVPIIPDCVDETLFQLLFAIDQGCIQLNFRSKSGDMIDLSEAGLGELAGWFMGKGGWRSKYSSERFNDDFSDLA